LPTTADFDAWDFRDLACRSIVHIGPISLKVTTPQRALRAGKHAPLKSIFQDIVRMNTWRLHLDGE